MGSHQHSAWMNLRGRKRIAHRTGAALVNAIAIGRFLHLEPWPNLFHPRVARVPPMVFLPAAVGIYLGLRRAGIAARNLPQSAALSAESRIMIFGEAQLRERGESGH